MFPAPQWPQLWQTYDETQTEEYVEYEDDIEQASQEMEPDNELSDNVVDKPAQSTVIKSALLASHMTKYVDEIGENANAEVAEIANQIWTAKQEKEAMKDLFKRTRRPSNVNIQKEEINEEVLTSIPQAAKARDIQLRSIQGITAKATVPFVDTLTALIDTIRKFPCFKNTLLYVKLGLCQVLTNRFGGFFIRIGPIVQDCWGLVPVRGWWSSCGLEINWKDWFLCSM